MKLFLFSIFAFFLYTEVLLSQEVKLIANVYENKPNSRSRPSEYCIENKKYRGYAYRINGKNIFLPDKQTLKTNTVYLFEGSWKKDLTLHIQEIGNCEPEIIREQIRSDWLAEENYSKEGRILSWSTGVTTIERLKELSFFEVKRYKKVDVVQCKNKSQNLEIEIKPNLAELKGIKLQLISHYEGGRGKPKAKFLNQQIRLKNKNKILEIPKLIQEEPGKKFSSFRLETVNILYESKNLYFYWNLSVYDCK